MVTKTQEKLDETMVSQAGLDTTTNPALPSGTTVTGTPLEVKTDELATQPTINTTPTTPTSEVATTNLEVAVPQSPNVSTYSAYTNPNTPSASAVTGTLNSQAIVGNIQKLMLLWLNEV